MMPSARVRESTAAAFSAESMSPFAMTGMFTAALISAIVSYSA
jgi:hypothetical protein